MEILPTTRYVSFTKSGTGMYDQRNIADSKTIRRVVETGLSAKSFQRSDFFNPSFRLWIKILYNYSLLHFQIVCYGTTFVYCFLERFAREGTYPQSRINFLLSWLRPSAFSHMHHVIIFTMHGNYDSILTCQLLPQT